MNESILSIRELTKRFKSTEAVHAISLDVPRGSLFGFLGPNGAGKTTTISMILGLLHPSAGEIFLLGQKVTPNRTRVLRQVGALVGSPALVPYLSGRDHLTMLARTKPSQSRARVEEMIALLGLEKVASAAAGRYSTGEKQRLGLAMALLHRPQLLILDEPTNGLDPAGILEIRQLLRRLAQEGVTVFLSSHLLHEVEQICDHVAVLEKGRLVACGEMDQLLQGREPVIHVVTQAPLQAAWLLEQMEGAANITPNGREVTLTGVSSQNATAHLVQGGLIPEQVIVDQTGLEHVFFELTQDLSSK